MRAAGPSDEELADEAGMVLSRRLLQLRRPLPLPPGGVTVATRPFRLGVDEAAFLEANARAFAALPDQGDWSLDVLLEREHRPWFDPEGFLLHDEDGKLAAFCWTKLHRRTPSGGHGSAADAAASPGPAQAPLLGEIYVIGVDPSAQGHGLGRAMLHAGCEYLHRAGAGEVMLYVDEANVAARALYDSSGFALHHEDRSYSVELAAVAP